MIRRLFKHSGSGSFFCITLLFSLFIATSAFAKEYAIPKVDIEVRVNPDGTVQVTEHRTYVFDGEFSWANYRLPKQGYTDIKNVRVLENGTPYINQNTEEKGTFLVEESEDAVNIKWYYKAKDQQRVFTITYTLMGALTIGPEWSQFFWNYAASGREKPTDSIIINIEFPQNVPQSELYNWIRNPETGIEGRPINNGFRFNGTEISRKESVRIRTVFPSYLLNSDAVQVTDSDFSLSWAEQDEEAYQQALQERREREAYLFELGLQLAIALGLLSIAAFILIYRKYGARHKLTYVPKESLVIPGDLRPAVIGWLMAGRTTTGGHVIATLLDLARREYFTINEQKEEQSGWGNEDEQIFTVSPSFKDISPELTEWEESMVHFVRQRAEADHHKIEDIFNYSDSEVSKWFRGWKKLIKDHAQEKNWIDRESFKGMFRNFGVQFVFIALSVIAIIYTHEIVLVSAIISLLAFIFSFAMIRRTPRGEEVFQSWNAYKDALKDAPEYSISEDHLGRHFIYAVTFGLGKQHIEELFETNPEAINAIFWIVLMPGSTSHPSNIGTSFSTLSATGTSSFGGTGGGAGASAGAAGGGASGGAG